VTPNNGGPYSLRFQGNWDSMSQGFWDTSTRRCPWIWPNMPSRQFSWKGSLDRKLCIRLFREFNIRRKFAALLQPRFNPCFGHFPLFRSSNSVTTAKYEGPSASLARIDPAYSQTLLSLMQEASHGSHSAKSPLAALTNPSNS
jgi:hypothetical protein